MMHCPKCGQQQVSEEVRYCSRCGLPLSGVAQLIAADGLHPALEQDGGKALRSPRRRGFRQGALMMFVAACLLPLIDALHIEPVILMLFIAGLMRMLYAAIFQEGAPRRRKKGEERAASYIPPASPSQMETRMNDAALPTAHSIPAGMYGRQARVDTSEMSPPRSVTENTTRLLDEQPDQQSR
jgi:hypothetical protein